MLLALDLGNTNLTIGLYRDTTLAHTFRAATVRARTADEYAIILNQLLSVHRLDPQEVTDAIMASVVPPLTDVLARAIEISFGVEVKVVGPGIKTGVHVNYDNPHDVGADRIVNAVAAFEKAKGGAIVVDLGTATTFDCISSSGEYVGGIIASGVQVGLDALLARAAKLRPIPIAHPPRVVGRNTTHSLQSGVVFGYACMIDGLVHRIRGEMPGLNRVIATGGLASLIVRSCTTVDEVDPNLTLDGLRIIYERNVKR